MTRIAEKLDQIPVLRNLLLLRFFKTCGMDIDCSCNSLQFPLVSQRHEKSYLELIAAVDEALRDAREAVEAKIEDAEILEVLELSGAEHRVEVVSELVVAQVDLLQGVLHSVKQPLCQPPHAVVREVHDLQRDVGGSEDLGGKQLPAHVLLGELLDVVAKRQHREVPGEHYAIAVDPRGVDLVEAAEAGHADGVTEL